MQRTRTVFFGNKVLMATFVLAMFGWGFGFYGTPVYLKTVVERTGWSIALVSGAVTLHFLLGAVVLANFPRLYKALGVPRVTFLGALLSAVGTYGWAVSVTPFHLYLSAGLSGAGWVALGAAAVNRLIAPWFVAKRPAALGLAYNGASVGGIVFASLWVTLIERWSFATAAAVLGATMIVVIGMLCTRVFVHTPASLGQHPDDGAPPATKGRAAAVTTVAVRSFWSDRHFVTLTLGMALGLFAQIGLVAHLFFFLVAGLGDQLAGFAMSFATFCAMAGRSVISRTISADSNRRRVACICYGVQCIGSITLMLFGDNAAMLWIGLALFGFGIGNATSLPPLIAQTEFTPDDAQRAIPLMVGVSQAAYAFAPAVFGLVRSWEGSAGWAAGSAMFTLTALVQVGAMVALCASGLPSCWRSSACRSKSPR